MGRFYNDSLVRGIVVNKGYSFKNSVSGHAYQSGSNGVREWYIVDPFDGKSYKVNPHSIECCTRFNDCDGVAIFENDILVDGKTEYRVLWDGKWGMWVARELLTGAYLPLYRLLETAFTQVKSRVLDDEHEYIPWVAAYWHDGFTVVRADDIDEYGGANHIGAEYFEHRENAVQAADKQNAAAGIYIEESDW